MPKPKPAPNSKSKKVADTTKSLPKRRLAPPTYKSFRLSKRIRQPKPPIIGAFRLFVTSTKFVCKKWRLFGGIVIIYLILTIVFVKGLGAESNINELRDTIQTLFHGSTAQLSTSLTLFSFLLGNANATSSELAGTYQSLLLIIISLVLIWALRHSLAAKNARITIRDAFYKSLYPLIPFVLVLMVIGLQLIPLLLVNFLYSAIIVGGLAVTALEQVLWITFFCLMGLLSIYMVSSSLFALYIVTLPDVRPMQALKSARELVRHRRLIVLRKVLFLPLALLILAAIIVVPVIIVSPATAEWLFFVLSMTALAVGHSYIYHLYRELL